MRGGQAGVAISSGGQSPQSWKQPTTDVLNDPLALS